jgi:hypothetical protein
LLAQSNRNDYDCRQATAGGKAMSDVTQVEAVDPAKKTSPITGPVHDEATVQMDQIEETCFWNDTEFTLGDRVSVDGKCYECNLGRWVEIDD